MKNYFFYLVLAGLLFTTSCEKDEPVATTSTNNCEQIIVTVTTDISTPTIWEDCHVYVINANQISVSSTLTIQPGAIIKFKENVGDNAIQVSSSGQIIAVGTVDKPVIFTSYKDDANGGDNNADGNATSPARGDWGGIVLNADNSQFKYCTFLYSGEGPNVGAGQPTLEFQFFYGIIDHCLFVNCVGEKSHTGYGVVDARSCRNQKFSITNSVFYDCIRPMFLNPFLSLDNSNMFHNPANPSQVNEMNGIFMTSEGDEATTDVSWLETEVPFVLTGSLAIGKGMKLILAENVIIKIMDLPAIGYNKISLHEGSSSIVGHDLVGVFFTSYFDDAHGGDTNGDGSGSAPSKGDWYGVQDITATISTNNFCYAWGSILNAKYP